MSFDKYLSEQISLHPAMQNQDMLKLCFQAAFGAEHLLKDSARAYMMLEEEFNSVKAADGLLFEEISEDHMRINISVWKYKELPLKWLFNIFLFSSNMNSGSNENFLEYLDICRAKAEPLIWDSFINEYKRKGIKPVHHSEYYRENERPSYRLANKCFINVLPILEAAAKRSSKPCIIAIDGRAASGKSTLAKYVSAAIGADIVHMDDFFLPTNLRTTQRLNEVGGNIHYERFIEEVLLKIKSEEHFSYNIFSCSKMELDGIREINSIDFRIIEGVYCLHPKFDNYADICVFSDIDSDAQLERIINRDGKNYAKVFESTWIPMEEAYFNAFNISEKCILHIKNN